VARLFEFSSPPWFKQARHVSWEVGKWRLATDERRAIRQAYEDAISKFADASAVLYRRAADGVPATVDELQAYEQAQVRLEVARATYNQSLWRSV
jgi:hypothetical protein